MRRFLLLTLLAVIAFSPVIFMKKSKTEISEEGYIGKSEIVIEDGGVYTINPDICVDCGACAGECPVEAISEE